MKKSTKKSFIALLYMLFFSINILAQNEQIDTLNNITIKAERTLLKNYVDRAVFDVTADPDAKRKKIIEIMKKIPFVTQDSKTGGIIYEGKRISKILVNGQEDPLLNSTNQYVMNLIKADVMKTIEILYPGSSDNPYPFIVMNIILAKKLPQGFASNVSATYSTNNNLNGSVDFISKINKTYILAGYNTSFNNSPSLSTIIKKTNLEEEFINESNNYNYGFTNNFNVGISQEYLNNTFKVNLSTSTLALHSITEYNSIKNIAHSKQVPQLNLKAGWSKQTKKTYSSINYSYNANKKNLNNYKLDVLNNYNNLYETSHAISFRVTRRFGKKHTLNTNGNFTYRYYSSENLKDRLKYNQAIEEVNLNYKYSIPKFNMMFNLKETNTLNKGDYFNTYASSIKNNEFNILPSMSFIYMFSKIFKLSLKYHTNILRPDITLLNPYIDDSDPYNIFTGNPNLKSEYTHQISLKGILNKGNWFSGTLEPNFDYCNNTIQYITSVNSDGISLTTFENIGKRINYSTNLMLSFRIIKGLTISTDLRLINTFYDIQDLNIKKNFFYIKNYTSINMNLWKNGFLGLSNTINPISIQPQIKKIKYYSNYSLI